MDDLNRPATLNEIADCSGVNKKTIQKRATKQMWPYTEEQSRSRYKKRLYTLKALPKDLRDSLYTARFEKTITPYLEVINDNTSSETELSRDTQRPTGGGNKQRSNRQQQASNHIPSGSVVSGTGSGQQLNLGASNVSGKKINDACPSSGAGKIIGNGSSEGTGENGVYPNEQRGLGTNNKGQIDSAISSSQLARTDSAYKLAHYTEAQRESNIAITNVMRFIYDFEGTKAAAIRYLNTAYKEETLPSNLVWALENTKLKKSGVNKSGLVLAKDTIPKWERRFKKYGHYIPQVRQKETEIKPWHADLVAMLMNNPQKKPVVWMHEQLEKKYEKDVSKDMVWKFVRERFSQGDLIKGGNTGMQLRAKQAYQPRTSNGLLPWQEMHADGWATHFTAPHPRSGDFVTFEVWHFHDLATRYTPKFGVGLTECFEVIAKGVENAIRDEGVMCILQTDSTKIIKNNAKFTGDPVKSIADKSGFTIVHPKTVGNAQANGIAENFNTWLDKEARELATYQAKGMDSMTLRRTKKITADMVKAANKGDMELRDKLKLQAAKTGKGLILDSYPELLEWLEEKRCKWNNKPHRSLKKIRDNITGKKRHQTPQESLDEFKADGWEPVMMDEAILTDLFLIHAPVKVNRGMVKPYGGMLFRNKELDHWEGKKVIVAYDSMNYDQVWVKDLKGGLICIAPFLEPTGYRSVTAYEAAEEKRAVARIRNKEKQIQREKAKAGIEDHNIIDVTPSSKGLKRVEEGLIQHVKAELNVVDTEPKQEEETEQKDYLELWGMLLSDEKENDSPKDGTVGL